MDDTRIKELSEEIKAARLAYYNLNPILTDQAYDALIDELKKLDPNHPEILAIGAPITQHTIWEKVKHIIPMGSLDKVKTSDEFRKWAEDAKVKNFLITHKIDGSSLEVVYRDGKLAMAVSRGDGTIGENITANAIQIPNLPKTIDIRIAGTDAKEVIIRGEVVMLKEVFQRLYASEYANPRNTAAGKIRDKKNKGSDCANLTFIAYTIMCDGIPKTEFYRFILLKNLGFEVPVCQAGDIDSIIQYHESVKANRDAVPYEIDGTVIRINDVETQEALGDLNMRPRGQIAWKFDPYMGVSKIVNIKWQVGASNSGRITPVAVIEPINVGGVTITNISLHNLGVFNELKLKKGDKVLISRRSDVIPYIEENLDSK